MKHFLPLLALPLIAGCNAYARAPDSYGAQSSAAARGGQCFYANNVTGFRQGPGDTIIVNGGGGPTTPLVVYGDVNSTLAASVAR